VAKAAEATHEATIGTLTAALQQARARAQARGAELAAATRGLAEHVGLRAVLRARGLVDAQEWAAALTGLLRQRGGELLAALELTSAAALAELLDRRIVLVDGALAAELEADQDCVAVAVPPPRCEVTGGSDVRAAYYRLVEACHAARVTRITIVGGSPAYRKQLKGLAAPHRDTLRLEVVSGTRRRVRHRVEADLRSSDLIVLWGATLLDHSVSGGYTGSGTPTLMVPHRGISGMLARLSESIAAHPR
jgi:hypothetical protein